MTRRNLFFIFFASALLLALILSFSTPDEIQAQASVGPASADLKISKTGAPNPVVAGQPLTYTIVVANLGPGTATNVVVKDTLPSGVHFNGISQINILNGTGPAIVVASSALTGTVATLNVGGVITITGRTLVSAGATGVSLLNTASVTTTNDLLPGNNTTSVTTSLLTATPTNTPTPIPTAVDLGISKSSAPNPVAAGQALTYTLVVVNAGPSSAQNVVVKDTLPSGVNFNGISQISVLNGTGSALLLSSTMLTGTVATLNVGGVITITGHTLVSAGATGASLLNTASVTTRRRHRAPRQHSHQ
ncbi:MAG: DUF11 domain-containing protein [Chloroflexi bacterium]|nr:DUF11 domain-containing protein [Chloroflexota bacterium]